MTWKKGRVSLTEPAFHTCSAPTANRKGCRGVALWGLTQLQPEVTSSTFTNLSLMHPTGTGALMLLSSLQATVSRHAGRAEKWDGAIERTSIKEGKLETTDSFPQHPLRAGEPMRSPTARERGNDEGVLIPPRECQIQLQNRVCTVLGQLDFWGREMGCFV